MRTRVIAAVAVLLLAGAVAVRADEEKVPLDKVPKAVLDAVKAKFPGAEIKGASKEMEDKQLFYELSIVNKGQKIDVTVKPDGTITLLEKEIAAKDLPKAVTDALEKKYPKATYKIVEEIVKVEGKEDKFQHYEVLLVTADKKTFEVEVSAKGEILKTEEKKGKKDD